MFVSEASKPCQDVFMNAFGDDPAAQIIGPNDVTKTMLQHGINHT